MNGHSETSNEWIYDQVFRAVLEQRLIPGTKLKEIEQILGYVAKSEVIHKDDMVKV